MSAEYRPLLIFVMTNLPGLATNVTTAYIMTEPLVFLHNAVPVNGKCCNYSFSKNESTN